MFSSSLAKQMENCRSPSCESDRTNPASRSATDGAGRWAVLQVGMGPKLCAYTLTDAT